MRKMLFHRSHVVILTLLLLAPMVAIGGGAQADFYRDPVYGFTLEYPSNWSVVATSEGADRVLRLQTPDGNASAEVRAVQTPEGFTATKLRAVFAETVFPHAQFVGAKPESFVGLQGEVAAWRMTVDGRGLAVGGFFSVTGPVGYILLTMAAEADFERRAMEIDTVLNTFKLGYSVLGNSGHSKTNGGGGDSGDR